MGLETHYYGVDPTFAVSCDSCGANMGPPGIEDGHGNVRGRIEHAEEFTSKTEAERSAINRHWLVEFDEAYCPTCVKDFGYESAR